MAFEMKRSVFANTRTGVRLQTLVMLRWLAVAGQMAAVLIVNFGLEFTLPLGPCLAAIAASAWLNVFLSIRYRATVRLSQPQAAIYLAYDLLQLSTLLYFTGGLGNPFALLLLVPVTISATTLTPRLTILLLSLSLACVAALGFFSVPLPWREGETLHLPTIYQMGIGTALFLGLGFMTVFAWRIAEETRRMSNALEATEMVLAREQRLSALDGLAAAAAHELGTPLGTIALVARELQRNKPTDEQMDEDLALLRSQAERCKEILSRLTMRPDKRDALYSRIEIQALIAEVIGPHQDMDVFFDVKVEGAEGVSAPAFARRPEILYGLGNFVENAADFARKRVAVSVTYDANRIRLSITDDGPGFNADLMDKLGEPYLTTRPRGLADRRADQGTHEGMGLGFFIGKTLLERSGADVAIGNRTDGVTGAVVVVEWPRDAVEAAPMGAADEQIEDEDLA
ncbi:MAG: ActS/PrrB/RegB family redox-sensitive histidine kinase [Parvibaculaceae bacterium]|jgi:two-component system sensor histidine kinase RegB|nr:ActS/PrrB/RegB family redox-sensitive histidine kinase [Parvibaculaceae bacterium]